MNRAFCNQCGNLVPASHVERDARIFLAKDCPTCGKTETAISSSADRYQAKRSFETPFAYRDCRLACVGCDHGSRPNLVFVDVTTRCNLNCTICINNTPSMGFLFEPPIEYFERIFRDLGAFPERPAVQLFGGEPTMRDDLFEIIACAKSYGLPVRVVTNGVKLADPEYCQRLLATRATILIAYDGADPKLYQELRGSAAMLGKKVQALDNIAARGHAKVTLMTLIARGFNDHELPGMLQLAHDKRQVIRAIYFMPLAHTWEQGRFAAEPPRTTIEDVEQMVADRFAEDTPYFVPAGAIGQLRHLMAALDMKPMPFLGAHPNCESLYLLISDGKQFVPIDRYLKTSFIELTRALCNADRELAPLLPASGSLSGMRKLWVRARAIAKLARVATKHARLSACVQGSGLANLYHAASIPLGFLLGRRSRRVLRTHSRVQGALQLIVLPFEDKENLETERLERCPTAFAYYDPKAEMVGYVPTCAWSLHKTAAMQQIMAHYRQTDANLPAAAAS
jgi:uncharacterized radical SAM superfamily Fe-S cluster-containing enzyme